MIPAVPTKGAVWTAWGNVLVSVRLLFGICSILVRSLSLCSCRSLAEMSSKTPSLSLRLRMAATRGGGSMVRIWCVLVARLLRRWCVLLVSAGVSRRPGWEHSGLVLRILNRSGRGVILVMDVLGSSSRALRTETQYLEGILRASEKWKQNWKHVAAFAFHFAATSVVFPESGNKTGNKFPLRRHPSSNDVRNLVSF